MFVLEVVEHGVREGPVGDGLDSVVVVEQEFVLGLDGVDDDEFVHGGRVDGQLLFGVLKGFPGVAALPRFEGGGSEVVDGGVFDAEGQHFLVLVGLVQEVRLEEFEDEFDYLAFGFPGTA
jgi:hypothetical protein